MQDKSDRREKALIIGDLPHRYLDEWEITSDLALAEAKMGVHLEQVPAAELIAHYGRLRPDELNQATALAERLVTETSERSPFPVAMPEVAKAARLYVALKGFVAQRGANAVTIDCGPFYQGADTSLPCAALTLLQDAGIAAGCQVDVDALLTMILFKRVTDQPTFMGGPLESEGYLAVSHCAMPLRMAGLDASQQPYCLGGHHGAETDPTIRTRLPAGVTVTLARLTRNLERLILVAGTIAGSRGEIEGSPCCNTLLVEVPDLAKLRSVIKGFQYHLIVARGDHTEPLADLAQRLEIVITPGGTQP